MIPEKISLAYLPTPIQKLNQIGEEYQKQIYVKRDDLTGVEYSGNKIRKLEYAVKEALEENCDVLITCGGIQSNHARATAAVASKLGLSCHLVLSKEEEPALQGNYFLDQLFGAKITFLSEKEFEHHHQVMETLREEYRKEGKKAYLIPLGASNGIGTFGYANAFFEILEQEKRENIHFDTIVCAVGSGGTYGGLLLGNYLKGENRKIIGVNVSRTNEYFENRVSEILRETFSYLEKPFDEGVFTMDIRDGYVGPGYAKATEKERNVIVQLARKEGIVVDPVYTAKAFGGMIDELKKGKIEGENILFIHTGGLYGLFPAADSFTSLLGK